MLLCIVKGRNWMLGCMAKKPSYNKHPLNEFPKRSFQFPSAALYSPTLTRNWLVWEYQHRCPLGEGPQYKNDGGCSSENLQRTPKRYQDAGLWAWLEISFTLIPILKQHIISCPSFSTQYPKRYRKSSLGGTDSAFLTPKRYDADPRPFYLWVPPPGEAAMTLCRNLLSKKSQ